MHQNHLDVVYEFRKCDIETFAHIFNNRDVITRVDSVVTLLVDNEILNMRP